MMDDWLRSMAIAIAVHDPRAQAIIKNLIEEPITITQTQVVKLWFPFGGRFWERRIVLPPPRLKQLLARLECHVFGHDWGDWRVETQEWFEYVPAPERFAMRGCSRQCGTMEHCR